MTGASSLRAAALGLVLVCLLGGCAGPEPTVRFAGGLPVVVRFEMAPPVQRENDRYFSWVSVDVVTQGVTLTDFSFTVFDDDGDGVYQERERLRQAGGWGLTPRTRDRVGGLAVPAVERPWIRAWARTSRGPVSASWPIDS